MSRSARTRAAILRAATELFRRYGYRRASVDAIAASAEVAKPTIYAYFDDKAALFVAVCEALFDEILDDTRTASSEPDAADRLTAMLKAKFSRLYEVVHASPHARELIDSKDEHARRVVRDADERYAGLLERAVRDAVKQGELDLKPLGLRPKAMAAVLMQLAYGASYGTKSREEHEAKVERGTRALLLAARPRGTSSR